jgi:5,10-methylenetetrahydromethanopterin reductase
MGRDGRGVAERKAQHGTDVVLELGGGRAFDRPVRRVVRAGGDLVHEEMPIGREQLDREHAGRAGDLRDPTGERRRAVRQVGFEVPRVADLAADPVDLRRLDRRPGDGRPVAPPGDHDRELNVDVDVRLDEERRPSAHGDLAQGAGRLLPSDRPDALPVVSAPRGLHHYRPAVRSGERVDRRRELLGIGCGVGGVASVAEHLVAGNRQARGREPLAHLRLVHRDPQRLHTRAKLHAVSLELVQQVEIDLLVVEGDDVAARREGPQRIPVGRLAEEDLGRDQGGRVIRSRGEHDRADPEPARRFDHHAGELPGADDPEGARRPGYLGFPVAGHDGTLPVPNVVHVRIGVLIDQHPSVPEICDQLASLRERGITSAWVSQVFGYDALTLLAALGEKVQGVELGTAVVPVHSRLPQAMAQQVLTVQAVTGGRLTLGIGLSHQAVVEGLWGLSFERPVRYMREYLRALLPMLHGEVADHEGEVVTARTLGPLEVPGASPPSVVVAALGSEMLRLAGSVADGTVTWMTGTETVASHIVPTITAAAATAGRPSPRVVVALPVVVTADADGARRRIDEALAIYPTLPSYRAMLDREGASEPSDISFVGDETAVVNALGRLADAGATEFVASVMGDTEERRRTAEVLSQYADAS